MSKSQSLLTFSSKSCFSCLVEIETKLELNTDGPSMEMFFPFKGPDETQSKVVHMATGSSDPPLIDSPLTAK